MYISGPSDLETSDNIIKKMFSFGGGWESA